MDSIAILFELHNLLAVIWVLLSGYEIQTVTNLLLLPFGWTELIACLCFIFFADLVPLFFATVFKKNVAFEHHRILHFANQFLDKAVSIIWTEVNYFVVD